MARAQRRGGLRPTRVLNLEALREPCEVPVQLPGLYGERSRRLFPSRTDSRPPGVGKRQRPQRYRSPDTPPKRASWVDAFAALLAYRAPGRGHMPTSPDNGPAHGSPSLRLAVLPGQQPRDRVVYSCLVLFGQTASPGQGCYVARLLLRPLRHERLVVRFEASWSWVCRNATVSRSIDASQDRKSCEALVHLLRSCNRRSGATLGALRVCAPLWTGLVTRTRHQATTRVGRRRSRADVCQQST